MQRSAATPTQAAAPFFSSLFGGGGGSNANLNTNSQASRDNHNGNPPPSPGTKSPRSRSRSKSRPPTSSGEAIAGGSPRQFNQLHKDRKPSFGRKLSFNFAAANSSRRPDSPSVHGAGPAYPPPSIQLSTDNIDPISTEPLARSPASPSGFSKMLSRGAVTPISGYPVQLGPSINSGSNIPIQSEMSAVHQHIQETINKRISTLEYLRKAHEGRIYWFNTLLFDKPDLQRMPYFDSRKLARRATNYLLLGISLPAVIDLNSTTPAELLRSLNHLLTEFDAFQQLHAEHGAGPSSLTRAARIPQMFRRAAAPVSKGRRSSSAAGRDMLSASALNMGGVGADPGTGLYALEQVDSNPAGGAGIHPTTSPDESTSSIAPNHMLATGAGGVMAFGASEVDLLPGEEYTHLLTPTLPFEPDFFETFATLCDVLIDTYTRLLGLVATPSVCGGAVGELFGKADGKVRKLLVQGVIKEFEEGSRVGVKGEVASVGRVVLSGLM